MDGVRLGAALRAVRIRRRMRQVDVARAAGVSQATVSRIERGRIDRVAVGLVGRVATTLGVRTEWRTWWRGGELDRMLSAGHAAMHELVARELVGLGWHVAPETSFSIYGERGVIDVLAYHEPTQSLLVVELKTALIDVQGLVGAVDRYRRLAPRIASQHGWAAASASCWVVLRQSPTNHRRLAAHASVLRAAFPDDGRRMRSWLRHPRGTVAALGFLSANPGLTAMSGSAGVQRVRRRSPSAECRPDAVRPSLGDC